LNIEREYYENEDFWSPAALDTEDERFRVQAIANLIPENVNTVLDVGCGNGMFVNHILSLPRKFEKVVAVDRSSTALKHVKAEKHLMSIDQLDFSNRSFDLVTCLEVIEHLPLKSFTAGLAEICRVAKKFVIVSVPHEEDLQATLISCPSCHSHFNPDYHMRSFNQARMNELLSDFGFRCRLVKHLRAQLSYRWISPFLNPRFAVGQRTNPSRTSIPCPVCGFYLPPSPLPNAANNSATATKRSLLRTLLKKLWPKETRYRWIAAQYERE
jgi:ubiquinone/menaquinone biosynthesis C-methylase UbiE